MKARILPILLAIAGASIADGGMSTSCSDDSPTATFRTRGFSLVRVTRNGAVMDSVSRARFRIAVPGNAAYTFTPFTTLEQARSSDEVVGASGEVERFVLWNSYGFLNQSVGFRRR